MQSRFGVPSAKELLGDDEQAARASEASRLWALSRREAAVPFTQFAFLPTRGHRSIVKDPPE